MTGRVSRRVPLLPTLLVLAAVGVMVRLGFWQLERLHEKAALLTRYAQAQAMSSDIPWPRNAAQAERALYRHSRLRCVRVKGVAPLAGTSARGEPGIAQVATCDLIGGGSARVVLGWSRDPAPRAWSGGEVAGIVAPGGGQGPKLIASPPVAGLEAHAAPDPSDIPNNHLSYAVQWFLFAATALVIYALALRKRLAGRSADR